ncbi:MAG: hypothetical protein JRE18_10665 [Deltaproteobacteria bacterium]|jgi:hypothetical protein|nr:hypothetical protein [Deltaproteobacteria bacterium]
MIFAYLDAGTGSLILQALLGGIAGVVVAAKAWKARMLGKKAGDAPAAETEPTSDESPVATES